MEMRRYKENKEKMRRRREEAKRRKAVTCSSFSVEPLTRKLSTKLTEGLPVVSQEDFDIDSNIISNVNCKSEEKTNENLAESSNSNRSLTTKHSLVDGEERPTKRIKSDLQHTKIRPETR